MSNAIKAGAVIGTAVCVGSVLLCCGGWGLIRLTAPAHVRLEPVERKPSFPPATPEQLASMQELVAKSMSAGVLHKADKTTVTVKCSVGPAWHRLPVEDKQMYANLWASYFHGVQPGWKPRSRVDAMDADIVILDARTGHEIAAFSHATGIKVH